MFFSTGTSVCQRTDQVVPSAIRVMAAPEYHRATIQPRFHSTDLHIPFPLISTPSVNAVTVLTAGSVTLPGLLDKVSFSVFFLHRRALFNMLNVGIRCAVHSSNGCPVFISVMVFLFFCLHQRSWLFLKTVYRCKMLINTIIACDNIPRVSLQ